MYFLYVEFLLPLLIACVLHKAMNSIVEHVNVVVVHVQTVDRKILLIMRVGVFSHSLGVKLHCFSCCHSSWRKNSGIACWRMSLQHWLELYFSRTPEATFPLNCSYFRWRASQNAKIEFSEKNMRWARFLSSCTWQSYLDFLSKMPVNCSSGRKAMIYISYEKK